MDDGAKEHRETSRSQAEQIASGEGSCASGRRDALVTTELAQEHVPGPWIIEVSPAQTQAYCLKEGESLLVGSKDGADLKILDPAVSARHCRISTANGVLCVEDLGSTNGLFVGGARVRSAQLSSGASFVVGRAVVTCSRPRSPDAAFDAPMVQLPGVVGTSIAMRRVMGEVLRLAKVRAPVLFRGETGSGKDVLAKALHCVSARQHRPFVPLNVGTLPRELADAELFGHERGAFTGAHAAREGAFVEAHTGTLFLDEIADLPLELQVKLLRVLEDGEVRAVGAKGRRKVDVRITSATWLPLEQRVAEGAFRQDLYQRLAVFVVDVPPLRDRRSDIPLLTEKILGDMHSEVGPKELTSSAMAKLQVYRWPGNVRELRNVLYRAAVQSEGRWIHGESVQDSLSYAAIPGRAALSSAQARALAESLGGNVSAAARQLGIARSTFRGWLSPDTGAA